MSAPLTKLTKQSQKWIWTDEQNNAFQKLKNALSTTPILSCPDFNSKFTLQVDASNEGLEASLTQKEGKSEFVIAYASRLLSDNETKFSVTEKECFALVWVVRKFRAYLEGYRFTAITDHQALRWLMSLEKPTGRLARWMLELQQHDIDIQYRKGELNRVADALSRNSQTEETVDCQLSVTIVPPMELDWYDMKLQEVSAHPHRLKNYFIKDSVLYRQFRSIRITGNVSFSFMNN